MEQLLRSGAGGGTPGANAAPSPPAQSTGRSGGFGARGGAGGVMRTPVKLGPFVAGLGSQEFQQIRMQWNEVLQRVKEAGISIHAWLINGEPVSAIQDSVLIAFKNEIHRETTEKPANREVIERVLQTVLKRDFKFSTIMVKEWLAATEGRPEEKPEPLMMDAGSVDGHTSRPEWVEEAVKLFGEELVVISEDH